MKKRLCFVAAILLLLLFSVTSHAYEFTVGDLYYNSLKDKAHEVEVTYKSYDGIGNNKDNLIQIAEIPETVKYTNTYTVTAIGPCAFRTCSSLTSVTIPNSVTSIEYDAFWGCTSLTSVTIGNSVTSIGVGAFAGCSSLTSIIIPNSVTSIEAVAFFCCVNLTSVTIGNSVTSIGDWAFYMCNSLTEITCKAVNPPSLDGTVFENVDKSIPLYVPAESINAYKAADQWKDFYNIHPIGGTPTADTAVHTDDRQLRKVLENGTLYILLPDGTRYDARGTMVK